MLLESIIICTSSCSRMDLGHFYKGAYALGNWHKGGGKGGKLGTEQRPSAYTLNFCLMVLLS